MARILSVASRRPRHCYSQAEIGEAVGRWLPPEVPEREKLLRSFGRCGVGQRSTVAPMENVFQPQPLDVRNRFFGEMFVALGAQAVKAALARGGWEPEEFHSFVTVSCTGFMIPSAEAHLIPLLGFPPSVRRLPITELGCAAGAAGLGVAADLVDARRSAGNDPAGKAVLVAAEFPSLNLQLEDTSPDQVISSALFGDGVAAVVLGTDASPTPESGPRIVRQRSHLFPDTTRIMGFDLHSSGFHIILSRELPDLIRSTLAERVGEFLKDLAWRTEEVRWWVVHPGGEKILAAAAELLHLPDGALRHSREVLRDWGNTSSAAVLLVLERVLEEAEPGDRGLILAFGPGFSMEMLALEW